jgi:hypothetical protein
MVQERRKLKRRHIMYYSRLFDRRTGAPLGYLGDLTPEGIMVISEHPIGVEQEFSLRMDLPEDIYDQPVLNFDAQSRWCQPDIDPRFYNTGFALTKISPADLAIISRIVEDFEVRK